jgi:alanine racemase
VSVRGSSPPTENLRCWAEIDLSAIRHNAEVASRLAGAGTGIMAIVKANAYGHGLAEVVRALRGFVAMFGVANLDEAQAVRAALGTDSPGDSAIRNPQPSEARQPIQSSTKPNWQSAIPSIFILGPALPGERPDIVAGGFVPAVSSLKEAAAYSALGHQKPVHIHLAIDTGMGRMGIAEEDAREVIREILRMPDLVIDGIGTHLPVADEDEPFTREQLARFQGVLAGIRELGVQAPFIHALNSAGLFRFPGQGGTLARAGLMLYGSSPLPEYQVELRPALALKTRITLIRDLPAGHGISYGRTFITPHPMRVATLAIGYADGCNRHLSNQGADVLIHGQRCPLLGRVTMDQIMVDVSHVAEAAIGDEAILIGSSGSQQILAADVAAKAGTIAWEIFTSIGPRVDRVYLSFENEEVV